eukprot:12051429-Alexandrium_andersonii.AAC.1
MSASLVGSEMCIRDRKKRGSFARAAEPELTAAIGARPPEANADEKVEESRYQANLQVFLAWASHASVIDEAK